MCIDFAHNKKKTIGDKDRQGYYMYPWYSMIAVVFKVSIIGVIVWLVFIFVGITTIALHTKTIADLSLQYGSCGLAEKSNS